MFIQINEKRINQKKREEEKINGKNIIEKLRKKPAAAYLNVETWPNRTEKRARIHTGIVYELSEKPA